MGLVDAGRARDISFTEKLQHSDDSFGSDRNVQTVTLWLLSFPRAQRAVRDPGVLLVPSPTRAHLTPGSGLQVPH